MNPSPFGIVGSGSMAAGVAQLMAEAGYEVALHPADEATLGLLRRALHRKAEKGQLGADAAARALRRVVPAASLDALAHCSVVVETQLRDREATQATLAALEAVLSPATLIALNTSAQTVSVLASRAAHPGRIAGLHFFEPAPVMRVVEVIAGLRTDQTVMPRLISFVETLGHAAVRVEDAPGFVVNRVGRALLTEGARIVAEKIATPQAVDRIARDTLGLRMGPFELLDLIGLDISLPVMDQLYDAYRQEPRLRPAPFLRLREAAGLHGRRAGGGFYAEPEKIGDAPALAGTAARPAIWIDPADADLHASVRKHLLRSSARLDLAEAPGADSLCLVMPLGADATETALRRGLDPRRTVAVDAVSGISARCALMAPPGLLPAYRAAALSAFGEAGAAEWIGDSKGFVAQRLLAAIVNLACEVAEQGVARPADIDHLVRLALGYPKGPLAWGDEFGPARILSVLQALHDDGDPRDRVCAWLRRRAHLGLSLTTPA